MPLVLLVLSQACLMGAFAQTYMMTGRKTVDGLDISCKQLNAQGKLMSSCREVGMQMLQHIGPVQTNALPALSSSIQPDVCMTPHIHPFPAVWWYCNAGSKV